VAYDIVEGATEGHKNNYVMLHVKYSVGIVLFYIAFFGCKNIRSSETKPDYFPNLQVEMRSPYGCYNEIQLDSTGLGSSIYGFRNDHDTTIKSRRQFTINSDSDKSKILAIMTRIQSRGPVSSPPGFDEYHFILMLGGTKFVDKYGGDSLVHKLSEALLHYVQIKENGECDYFNLITKTTE
jgi:hypothetical protein